MTPASCITFIFSITSLFSSTFLSKIKELASLPLVHSIEKHVGRANLPKIIANLLTLLILIKASLTRTKLVKFHCLGALGRVLLLFMFTLKPSSKVVRYIRHFGPVYYEGEWGEAMIGQISREFEQAEFKLLY